MSVYVPWIAFIIGLEAISALTIFHPSWHGAALVVFSLGLLVLAARKPALAFSFLLAEYVIGSKGALLRLGGDGLGHGGVPLRIAWFLAFFLGWMYWAARHRTYREWSTYLQGRTVYIVLGALLAYAFLVGYLRHNPFVLADANGWGVWLLLLPALDLARHAKEDLRRHLRPALLIASLWMIIKTLAFFYLFTHPISSTFLEAVYLWVRRTGVGEITRALPGANVWRVFFQSHIYLLPLIVWTFWQTLKQPKLTRLTWILGIGAGAALIVSLSRSLFLGVAAGLMVSLFIFLARKRETLPDGELPRLCTAITRSTFIILGTAILVGGLFYAPPRPSGSLGEALMARVQIGEEAAAVTRWKLLPALWQGIREHPILGSGFGATITYESRDPRIVQATGGAYTTYAFEWGWLEHWFKFGILGVPVLLWLLVHLVQRIRRSTYDVWWRGVLISSLSALAITHIFTPYLNHPLGIVSLILLEAALVEKRIDSFYPAP